MTSNAAQPTPPDGSDPDASGVRDSFIETLPWGRGARTTCPVDSRLGTVVAGRWRLVRVVGAGSVGAVYEGRDLQTEQAVAVKLLHDTLRTSREQGLRFLREAEMGSSLRHPNVVRVYDVGCESDGTFYQIQELLDGDNLGVRMSRHYMSTETALSIGLQLLSALHTVHQAGFLHRDIKPENIILLDTEGTAPQAKLVDFGIAKDLRPEDTAPGITLEGAVVGTPHYMSPEQLRGSPLTARSDLWGAGAVLFHTLAGSPPFDDEHLHRLLARVVSEPAPSLVTIRPDLPAHVVETIDRALSHDPSNRWDSAAQMARALAPR